MPTFGSLFAGIGGIDLGLERAGWTGRWQVEWDDYCSRVLAKHWPDVARYGDVHDVHGREACPVAHPASDRRTEGGEGGHFRPGDSGTNGEWAGELVGGRAGSGPLADATGNAGRIGDGDGEADGCPNCLEPVDLIAGGFPCQPFSFAGKQQRLADDRWLWPEFERCIRELRPRYVLVENVSGLLVGGGMDAVLGGLADLGYDSEWESIPAAAVGAPHLRYRVWIVAHTKDVGRKRDGRTRAWRAGPTDGSLAVADPEGARLEGRSLGWDSGTALSGPRQGCRPVSDQWSTEPDVGRVAHGVPARVDRLRSLGNAVVPQVVEWIGRRILEAEALT